MCHSTIKLLCWYLGCVSEISDMSKTIVFAQKQSSPAAGRLRQLGGDAAFGSG